MQINWTLPPIKLPGSIKLSIALAIVALAFAIGYLLPSRAPDPGDRIHEREVVRMRYDTAFVEMPVRMSTMRVRGHASYRRPVGRSLQYTLDTLVRFDTNARDPDTLSVIHAMPEDSFEVSMRFSQREVQARVPYIARDPIYSRIERSSDAETHRPWYQDILLVIASVVAGAIAGKVL